jgi:hypothetical protein
MIVGVAIAVGALLGAPAEADAQQLAPDLVSALVVELVPGTLSVSLETVLTIPDARLDPPDTSAKHSVTIPGAVHFFGRGIDISTELTGAPRDGSVLLALKPNFGKQGGVLRCTFRF